MDGNWMDSMDRMVSMMVGDGRRWKGINKRDG